MKVTLGGLPEKVHASHPIEFLELDKMVAAFLDLGLEEEKGGIGKQLLCGHLVAFIQKNGLEAISKLPRFKFEFLEEIVSKCHQKGISFIDQKETDLPTLHIEKEKTESKQINKPKKIKAMARKESQLLADQMRLYAQKITDALKNKLPGSKLGTKRFAVGAKGFEILVPEKMVSVAESCLASEKVKATPRGNGNIFVEYPKGEFERKDVSKELIKLCRNERSALLQELKKHQLFTKMGVSKDGTIQCNKTHQIALTNVLVIFVLNNNKDTLKDVFSVTTKYYKKHAKASLVVVAKGDFIVEVKFDPTFFVPAKKEDAPPPPLSPPSQDSRLTEADLVLSEVSTEKLKNEEIKTLFDIAFEHDLKLQQEQMLNKLEFLESIAQLVLKANQEIDDEAGVIKFKKTTDPEGRQILTEVFSTDRHESVSLKVFEKLGLNK